MTGPFEGELRPVGTTMGLPWSDLMREALDDPAVVSSVYQPIVDLRRRAVVGYEALSRFHPSDGVVRSPEAWIRAASHLGLGPQLEARMLESALQARDRLPRGCFLSVNVEPENLGDPDVREALFSHGELWGVVVEITEHREWEASAMEAVVQTLRTHGAMVAADDAGSGHAGLRQILALRPNVLKVDRSLVDGVAQDEAKAALVEMVARFASSINAWLVAEGVERAADLHRLLELDVPLVQGYLFARPGEAWPEVSEEAMADLDGFRATPRETMHRLVEEVTALQQGPSLGAAWAASEQEWMPVVDEFGRPVGIIDREAAASGTLVETLVASVQSSPVEIARRLSATRTDPGLPVVVTDDSGRYVGVVPLRRLLWRLSHHDDAGG